MLFITSLLKHSVDLKFVILILILSLKWASRICCSKVYAVVPVNLIVSITSIFNPVLRFSNLGEP